MHENIGIVLVHGIGEQGRFEHLDQQLRGLITGLERTAGSVTVEILAGDAEANLGKQATWRGGSSCAVRIFVREPSGDTKTFHIHEVWWADINETYSLAKQFRFWRWGLSIWWFPRYLEPDGDVARATMVSAQPSLSEQTWMRVKLLWICTFFMSTSITFGVFFNLVKRLLNVEPPRLVQTFVNYLGSIKLYNQPDRRGLGLPAEHADFLDALGEPPRYSIRRRMVQTLADVACAGYDGWYILAHSLGSVVAFNGLMEPGYTFPHYLDERRWRELKRKQLAGSIGASPHFVYAPPPGGKTKPRRPLWLADDEAAYRPAIFKNLRGLLTYGCPLGKFADIWPALAPYCREPAFQPGSVWLNAFDPLDPVSGPMPNMVVKDSPGKDGLLCCPPRTNVGYASSHLLLRGHIRYLTPTEDESDLAGRVAAWLLGGSPDLVSRPGRRFFEEDQPACRGRRRMLDLQWVLLYGAAAVAESLAAKWLVERFTKASPNFGGVLAAVLFAPPAITWAFGAAGHAWASRSRPPRLARSDVRSGQNRPAAPPRSLRGKPEEVVIEPL